MNDLYEEILAQLTDSQVLLIEKIVRSIGMIPVDAAPQDVKALVKEGLLEYSDPMYHKEDYTGNREVTAHGGGVPRPSELGREWVKWYSERKR